jgi:hypothetical protein
MNLIQFLCTLVSEECNEVGQRASKLSRFGADEVQEGHTLTNSQRLIQEKHDFAVVYNLLLSAAGYIDDPTEVPQMTRLEKEKKVLKYAQLSVSKGMIDRSVYHDLLQLTEYFADEEMLNACPM